MKLLLIVIDKGGGSFCLSSIVIGSQSWRQQWEILGKELGPDHQERLHLAIAGTLVMKGLKIFTSNERDGSYRRNEEPADYIRGIPETLTNAAYSENKGSLNVQPCPNMTSHFLEIHAIHCLINLIFQRAST
ncbi:hypothetical protein V2G26_018709 [Clonostachys chloroleuca]